MVILMNKQVNLLLSILGNEPDWQTEEVAEKQFLDYFYDGVFDKFYTKEFIKSFPSSASTLRGKDIGYCEEGKFTLHAYMHYDEYKWVNFFIAIFDDDKNFVVGDFEKAVVASNKKHYDILLKHVSLSHWDYGDI